jgi:hypothetical protein
MNYAQYVPGVTHQVIPDGTLFVTVGYDAIEVTEPFQAQNGQLFTIVFKRNGPDTTAVTFSGDFKFDGDVAPELPGTLYSYMVIQMVKAEGKFCEVSRSTYEPAA